MITRDLFLYGLKNRHLVYREKQSGRRVRLPVEPVEKVSNFLFCIEIYVKSTLICDIQ
jgi:hypothetical protein